MNIFLMIVALLIVLGVVVFIHELGHFLAARWVVFVLILFLSDSDLR